MSRIKRANENGSSKKRKSNGRCAVLGPVQTLEEHVRPDWWRRIFNSMYLKTDADVVEDANITRNEINLFSRILDLKPEDGILDLCCGQGRHTLELSRRGFKAEGFDRSRYLIQKARAAAKNENLPVRFREGDARKLPYPADTFDVVMVMGNSFGYFETANDDIRVLKEIFRVLKPWGRVLLDVSDGHYLRGNFQPRSWEWIDKKHFVCRERSLSADKNRLISREVITEISKGVVADQFYAERLYAKEDLAALLGETGFSNVGTGGVLVTDSQRNQDLGMMQRRIVITGQVRKEWTPKRNCKKGMKTITVLFGDPEKPDPL